MATIKLNRPSKEGFNAISKALFELTGNEYYLRPLCEQEDKPNFIDLFWFRKKELKLNIKKCGGIFTHHFCKLDGTIIPFIYNSLEF